MIQLTRDQTLVNRLVELGTLTPEEAETHPRRNELQQAVGGQPDVEPGVYHGILRPGEAARGDGFGDPAFLFPGKLNLHSVRSRMVNSG